MNGYQISNQEKEEFQKQAYNYAKSKAYDSIKNDNLWEVPNFDKVVNAMVDVLPFEGSGLSLVEYSNLRVSALNDPKIKHLAIFSGNLQLIKPKEIGGYKVWCELFIILKDSINKLAEMIDERIDKEVEEIYKKNPEMKKGSIFQNAQKIITA